ncbi:Transcriptional regulator [Frankia canadensis]|uniref:Transcriptional regulator n=1 Tax=Frankia canadensis TaxID=1836972 RepID=A0A2I2KYN2_9ACTN|nr:TetR/AcrR family transcriptional regulator [Frankia canadensis]SNQ50775.1 Transcriptional regulator [Frankia canadensis]SOU58065.1 Transcriptional regulator [Frankia canadensis]
MSPQGPRPGGRSARVQAAVHGAVLALQAERPRHEITVPLVAARAGVTPSTVYRRWGDLTELLADVAAARLRPDAAPADTGSLRGDLVAYAEQYLEEMSSPAGREVLRDLVAGAAPALPAGRCDAYVRGQLEAITARERARGGAPPPVGEIVERVMAPITYTILFVATALALADAARLVDALLAPRAAPVSPG